MYIGATVFILFFIMTVLLILSILKSLIKKNITQKQDHFSYYCQDL